MIVRTDRGLEVGEVLTEATEHVLGSMNNPGYGQILRPMTADDVRDQARLHEQEAREFEVCERLIAQEKLDMRLVDVEHLFGGERVVVFYLSENRVDFRELVRQLAAEFQTRVEMRQIGVRDEAKLLADYGDCGKPVCCNTHLSEMPPVSMKMAKIQKATLDPTKISGRCGRLKCCLRYEYDTYEALQKELPPVGSRRDHRPGPGPGAGPGDSGRATARRNRRSPPGADRCRRGVDGATRPLFTAAAATIHSRAAPSAPRRRRSAAGGDLRFRRAVVRPESPGPALGLGLGRDHVGSDRGQFLLQGFIRIVLVS